MLFESSRKRWKWVLAISIVFLFPSIPVLAADFHVDTTFLGQTRINENNQRETPLNGYLGFGGSQDGGWRFSGQVDMRFFGDPSLEISEYDLYQAVLHFTPVEKLQVDFGRQFINQGFFADVIDGIKTTITPSKYLEVVLYTGIPRSVEIGDFNKNDGLLSGLSLGLQGVPKTSARMHLAWLKNNIRFGDLPVNDEILLGFDASHQFGGPLKPMVYGLLEYDIPAKVLDAGTLGVDLYPHRRVSLNLEFNYFNINRDTIRPAVLGIFAQGPVITGRFSSTWTAVPNLLDVVQTYSYNNVEIQGGGVRRDGHLFDIAFPFSFESIGLYFQPEYYFQQSFGGRAHGVRGTIHEDFPKKVSLDVGVEYTNFKKVTNDNGFAFSTVIWAGYEVIKNLKVSAGFEFNKNPFFNQDIRGSWKISYQYDRNKI